MRREEERGREMRREEERGGEMRGEERGREMRRVGVEERRGEDGRVKGCPC